MNVSSEIIKILDYLGQKFGIAIDWSSQNVTPILKQLIEKYISWEIASSTVWIIIASIIFVLTIVWAILDTYCDWSDHFALIIIIPIGVVMFGVIIVQVFDIVRCIEFPELQVFNFLKSQMQSMNN